MGNRRLIGVQTVLDGAHFTTYNINTLVEIDANLECLHWNPHHPDVDRLLDARAWLLSTPITACILHADYHRMEADCWGAVLDWQQQPSERVTRDDYQAAVERRILDRFRDPDKDAE